jgi:hypothetical protein
MKLHRVLPGAALLTLGLSGCPTPEPTTDAASALDAGASDSATGWDHNVGGDVHFPPHDAGPGCGDVPAGGRCSDGGVLAWCEDNAVRSADCAALGLSCGEKPTLGGFWCLAGPNGNCRTWPCADPFICGPSWICSGWPDAGPLDGQHDGGSADRAAFDGPTADHAALDGGAEDRAAIDGSSGDGAVDDGAIEDGAAAAG